MSLALAPTPNRGPDATSAVDKAKMLSRAASSFTMPSDSLLWTLKARDYAHFWQQTHLELRSRVKCAHALREMATRKTSAVIVLESSGHAGDDAGHRAIAGLLSSTNFLSTQKGADRSKEIHSVERAIRKCGEASLRDVLHFCSGSDSRSTTNQYPFQCIHEDEAFFNVLLRFACGAECVGVIAETPDNTNSLLLGTFLVSTLLKWIEEDLTLFEGKERYPLRSFPSCFYAPATATRGTSMCEGFATMERRNLAGLLVSSNDTAVSEMLRCDESRRSIYANLGFGS
uniref:Uncharacterized protein n=1 Tax=Globisporangium ultimum (strain ATCC 200006 / CBS 805.95 / DAOM BR144) TaxID=431595 RepID=K3XC82_GLOUD